MFTVQSDGGNSLKEAASSQETLVCVELAKTKPAHSWLDF